MKKIFMIKKDVNLPAAEDNRSVLSEKEYIDFERTEEGQKRKKNICQLDKCEISDAMLFIETDVESVKSIRKEKDRKDYVKETRIEENIEIISLNYTEDDDSEDERMLIDLDTDIEEVVVGADEMARLEEVLNSLSKEEYRLIFCMYLAEKRDTERSYAVKIGKTASTVNYMKKQILEKLRMLMEG